MPDRPGIGRRRFLSGTAATVGGIGLVGAATEPARAALDVEDAAGGPASGPVAISPSDQQYPELVNGINKRYTGRPDTVYLVDHVDQVPEVVQRAVQENQRLTIRSGGHCLENFVDNSDVEIVLDLSKLNRVYYDPQRGAFAIEAGATVLDAYELLYHFWGVTMPAGICFSVGMGGHVSGGGWGMLCRQLGLVIDYLYAVEVVVVDVSGKVRTVVATREERDPNRELWWAHAGGGGGNFGVITRYWFRSPETPGGDPSRLLPRPPSSVLLHATAWPWSEMTRVGFANLVQNYGGWFAASSAPDSPSRALASFLVLNHRSHGEIGMVTQVDATVPEAREMMDSYLEAINRGVNVEPTPMARGMGEFNAMPAVAKPRHLPWLEATRYLALTNSALTDPTLRAEYKSAYMRDNFPDGHVATMYDHFTREVDVPGASVTLSSYGGQVNAVSADATAYPHRSSFYKLMWMSLWTRPEEDEKYIEWNRNFYEQLYADTGGVPVPNDVTDGCYVNYPDVDLNDPARNRSSVPWHDLYYKENYPRLQRVKAEWDPQNFFRHAQSVRPPESGSSI